MHICCIGTLWQPLHSYNFRPTFREGQPPTLRSHSQEVVLWLRFDSKPHLITPRNLLKVPGVSAKEGQGRELAPGT